MLLMAEPMRIQRALARAGVLSRRKAEELVADGRVTSTARSRKIGQSVDPERDVILVDGKPIGAPAPLEWFVLHKPAGVITSRRRSGRAKTVFDLVPKRPGLTYVGRLDYMTEGVLLSPRTATAAHRLTHPSREVERTYVASVTGDGEAAIEQAQYGVELEDGVVTPEARCAARRSGGDGGSSTITIAEGKNREIRRLCEALGLQVDRLVRVKFGPVELGDLPAGQGRGSLTRAEVKALEQAC